MSETTRLSSKGQIIIPKRLRDARRWEAGQEFIVQEIEDGILLKEKPAFAPTALDEVAGRLRYSGAPKSLDEMEEGIRKGARAHHSIANSGAGA